MNGDGRKPPASLDSRRRAHEEIYNGLKMILTGLGMIVAAYGRLYLGKI